MKFFSIFVGFCMVFMPCFGLLLPSKSLRYPRILHAPFINKYRQIYARMSNARSNDDDEDDDDENDLRNEVFMELVANQKKVRHNKKQNKIKIQPVGPEFSRIVNVAQVPGILKPYSARKLHYSFTL